MDVSVYCLSGRGGDGILDKSLSVQNLYKDFPSSWPIKVCIMPVYTSRVPFPQGRSALGAVTEVITDELVRV